MLHQKMLLLGVRIGRAELLPVHEELIVGRKFLQLHAADVRIAFQVEVRLR